MALELKLSKTSITSLGDRVTITDSTGDYNASSNTTGYGTPNDARADLALVLKAYNKRIDEGDVALTITSYDPEDVTEWEVFLNKDGWLQATVYGVKIYEASTAAIEYSVGEIVYDADADELLRVTVVNGSGSYTYTTVAAEESDLENEDYIKAYETIYNTNTLHNVCIGHYKSNEVWAASGKDEDFDDYNKIDARLKSINYAFRFENNSEAQQGIESLEVVLSCYNDITC